MNRDYIDFVDAVTSETTKSDLLLSERVLDIPEVRVSRLLNSGIGLAAEGGEYLDIIKKIVFQGKEITHEVEKQLLLELGDVMWYVAQACIALDTSFEEIVEMNKEKLADRYKSLQFTVDESENR